MSRNINPSCQPDELGSKISRILTIVFGIPLAVVLLVLVVVNIMALFYSFYLLLTTRELTVLALLGINLAMALVFLIIRSQFAGMLRKRGPEGMLAFKILCLSQMMPFILHVGGMAVIGLWMVAEAIILAAFELAL